MSALRKAAQDIAPVETTATTTKGDHEIPVDAFYSNQKCEEVRDQAFEQYQIGRKALYKALALSYYWYRMSENNSTYLEEMFKPFANQTNSHTYAKVVAVCLKLDVKAQAPTISKYKNAMSYVHQKFGDLSFTNVDKDLLEKIVQSIVDEGGIDACARAAKGSSKASSSSKKLSDDELKTVMKNLLETDMKPISSMGIPEGTNMPESKLALGLIRQIENKLQLIEVLTDEQVVKQVIRANATKRSDDKS